MSEGNPIEYTHPLECMQGHGKVKGNCCAYHEKKVGMSTKPGPEVYKAEHFKKIKGLLDGQTIEGLTAEQLVLNSLNIVDKYWLENRNELDTVANATHQRASAACEYLAGGWQASPHQYSQLFATMWAMAKQDQLNNDSKILLAGTASGAHTKQLTEVFQEVGQEPEVHAVDICRPPLQDSKGDVNSALQSDIAALPLQSGSIDMVTSHFVDSFLVKQVATHEEALEIRKNVYSELCRTTKKDGCLCMGIGTSGNIARFNTPEEIEKTLIKAGYSDVFILPTTDPLDYDKKNQQHTPGNYFVVAFKY